MCVFRKVSNCQNIFVELPWKQWWTFVDNKVYHMYRSLLLHIYFFSEIRRSRENDSKNKRGIPQSAGRQPPVALIFTLATLETDDWRSITRDRKTKKYIQCSRVKRKWESKKSVIRLICRYRGRRAISLSPLIPGIASRSAWHIRQDSHLDTACAARPPRVSKIRFDGDASSGTIAPSQEVSDGILAREIVSIIVLSCLLLPD